MELLFLYNFDKNVLYSYLLTYNYYFMPTHYKASVYQGNGGACNYRLEPTDGGDTLHANDDSAKLSTQVQPGAEITFPETNELRDAWEGENVAKSTVLALRRFSTGEERDLLNAIKNAA
jgi:hypothetical protein